MAANPGIDYDAGWVNEIAVNASAVHDSVKDIPNDKNTLHGADRAARLMRAISCIDLTTLSGNDTHTNVTALCRKALKPVEGSLLAKFGFEEPLTTAAVCIYPARIPDAASVIAPNSPVKIASVAAGFPSGLYGLQSRLMEIRHAVSSGATEIDVVIDRSLALTQQWSLLYDELKQMKEACGAAIMKTILATGELENFDNVYRASAVAMMAGSDFIKTSTGKEAVNATLPAGLVMIRAIREYQRRTGYKVGFKPAGGIRKAGDALDWLALVKRELGDDWLNKGYFRIGASGLLDDILKNLESLAETEFS